MANLGRKQNVYFETTIPKPETVHLLGKAQKQRFPYLQLSTF